MPSKDGCVMHKYSCDSDRRDTVYLASLIICAAVAFALAYIIDWAFGGINVILDFLLFVVSFGPFSFWVLFTDSFSHVLLRLSGIHDCSGTYKGELRTNYDEFTNSYPIIMVIKHGFREMEIRLSTERSRSCSKTASLHQDGGRVEIVYTYESGGSVDDGLNRHIGTCIISLENGAIEGTYYTHPDRKSYGKISAQVVVKQ